MFFVGLFLQQVAGYSALEGGLALLPVTLMLLALSGRWGALAGRVGPRPLMGFGPLFAAAGLALFARLDAGGDYFGVVLPAAIVFGLGLSMTVAPLTSTAMAGAPPELAGTASGVNNAVARIAGLLAIAIVGAVVASAFTSRLDHNLRGVQLDGPARIAVAQARRRPLDPVPVPRASAVAAEAEHAQVSAAVSAFRSGVLLSAALVAGGGLLALALLPRGLPSDPHARPTAAADA